MNFLPFNDKDMVNEHLQSAAIFTANKQENQIFQEKNHHNRDGECNNTYRITSGKAAETMRQEKYICKAQEKIGHQNKTGTT